MKHSDIEATTEENWLKNLKGTVCNEYVLDEYVGAGKIGVVYKGHSKTIPEWVVAVKLTETLKHGWETELHKVSQLSTIQGVVHFHNLGTDLIAYNSHSKQVQYTVWDFIPPGRNLGDFLKTHAKDVSVSFLFALMEQVLRVLHACQKKGIKRHGDLHAGNILIGQRDEADLDESLIPRQPIYVSDFGFGATGGNKQPKDDYLGLATLANEIIRTIDWERTTLSDRQRLQKLRELITKILKESCPAERLSPLDFLGEIRNLAQKISLVDMSEAQNSADATTTGIQRAETLTVGQFQASEMLGDRWEWWKRLFVAAIPARSRILGPDISTVVTGPRGCGKTMLFRRLSERLIVECGYVENDPSKQTFVGFYVNANDIGDAFAAFSERPSVPEQQNLICYFHLCVLSDLLGVLHSRLVRVNDSPPESILDLIHRWLIDVDAPRSTLVSGQNKLDYVRTILEQIKWRFLHDPSNSLFPAFVEFCQIGWLPRLFKTTKTMCKWFDGKSIFLFVDDYTTPRISESMQRVLNRILFQRSGEFICKLATESATTFIPQDSSNKVLQDGDDYQLIDMGEESLFMSEDERMTFLNNVLGRRLEADSRIPEKGRSLFGLLGESGVKKTEFARRLRGELGRHEGSRRRGAARSNVSYHGADVFSSLWSGDTRMMIQMITELIDQAILQTSSGLNVPIESERQDQVLRDRGGSWLEAQTRNLPSHREAFDRELRLVKKADSGYSLTVATYGAHLKAIVEAFVAAARKLLLGPTYRIGNREVPRMAFRIEIVDDFRIDGLAQEIYRDLIRYGLFMRDARGKSVRGAMVPRLYLRRLLLPYCTLALSKRDSVPLTCSNFMNLLLHPDKFKQSISRPRKTTKIRSEATLNFCDDANTIYDDLAVENL